MENYQETSGDYSSVLWRARWGVAAIGFASILFIPVAFGFLYDTGAHGSGIRAGLQVFGL